MAIKRVGSSRLPDNTQNVWNVASPNTIIPGDVLSGAPGFGGHELREARGPVITEADMTAHEVFNTPKTHRKHAKKPKVRAVLPPEASRIVELRGKDAPNRTAINLRIPTRLLQHFKDSGPKYQSRIVAVLELFVEEGGTFVEGD